MYTVRELLRQKGDAVQTIAPEATVLEAARRMNEHRIGSLVVVDGERPVGIITERDIMTKIVAEERAPAKTMVHEVMTGDLVTCAPSASLDQLRAAMRERRIRHIPVTENGKLVGMVSIGDVNTAEEQTLAETITHLEMYITR